MRIAITDANIFIDLSKLQLLQHLFGINLEIITTREVYNELHEWQQELLNAYQQTGKLQIHSFTTEEWEEVKELAPQRNLTQQDITVAYLAHKKEAIVLSGDNPLRKYCEKQHLEVRGILWIFDQFLEHQLINHTHALECLNKLMSFNARLPHAECEHRRKEWTIKANDITDL